MRKFLSRIINRTVITGTLILLQFLVLVILIWKLSIYANYFYFAFTLLSVIIAIFIVSNDETPSFKFPWIIIIILFPVFGGLFYLIFGRYHISNKRKNEIEKYNDKKSHPLIQNEKILSKLKKLNLVVYNQTNYIYKAGKMPVYENTNTLYFKTGEATFKKMILELKKAEKFIFLEYFIIDQGIMWNEILKILLEKVNQGLDVRVIYDDVGSLKTLPNNYFKKLNKAGIKCIAFNRFTPIASLFHNNRDHRKIMIIDNKVGFTGGINLADEYINKYPKYGFWKDTAIMLEGDAVTNLTSMFLKSWNFSKREDKNFSKFLDNGYKVEGNGFVQPYGSNPLNKELIAETVYSNIINSSNKYLYIMTPYLIVSYDMINDLCIAAKRGVDVRIITPYIADKWYVHMVTESNYKKLIESGVKVYEYRPGFIHAKVFIADDVVATVGTINLDYRSLRHHYECGTFIAYSTTIKAIKNDFIETFNESLLISKDSCDDITWYKKGIRDILKFFGPLL